ncbi:MAG: M23 family metallopeptidase [Candidatus Woesearchaeota archaeon]|nr:M23 family metallopeptidase [Candidatus Woesearchaeota archaeon]
MAFIGKRGNVLVLFLTITSIIIFTFLFMGFFQKEKKMTAGIGSEQFKILYAYQQGEMALVYIDTSGKYAIYDSIIEFADKGFFSSSECGSENGYSLWKNENGVECYPNKNSLKANFTEFYQDALDKYLSAYSTVMLPDARNYEFFLSENDKMLEIKAISDGLLPISLQATSAVSLGGIGAVGWPVDESGATITSCYGRRDYDVSRALGINPSHWGIDFALASGSPVYAVADGKITYSGYSGSYGNRIVISHSGFKTTYNHLSEIVRSSGEVKRGDVIGKVGSTGKSTGAHIHFEVLIDGNLVNPLCFYDTSKEVLKISVNDGGDNSCKNLRSRCVEISAEDIEKIKAQTYVPPQYLGKGSMGTMPKSPVPIEEELSGISYSVNPSFKASIEYSFEEYYTLAKRAEEIASACSGKSYYERDSCIKAQSSGLSDSVIEITPFCNPKEADASLGVFEKFIDYYQKCSSNDDNCYCLFEQEDSSDVPSADGKHVIRIEAAPDYSAYNADFSVSENMKIGITESFYNDLPEIKYKTLIYTANYNRGNFESASLRFYDDLSAYETEWDLSRIIIYKSNGEMAFVSPIEFWNDVPENKFLTSRQCLPGAKVYYFCAKVLSNSVPVYDAGKKSVENVNPIVKFALEIR